MLRASIITITVIITLCMLPSDSASAHPAWGIVIDRNNQIYFSDLETIWKIDAQGKLTVFRAGLSGRHVHEITLDEIGNLYGVDNAYEPATQRSISALWKMTPSGEFSYVLPPTSNPPKGMTNWKDRAGNSYYVGQSETAKRELFVLKRTPDGKVTTLAGSEKSGSEYRQVVLYCLGGMAFGTDGTLYFTDNANIRKVSMDGQMTMLARNLAVGNRAESAMPDSSVTRLFGIAADEQGNAFVADYGNRRVLKVTSGGVVSTVARAEQPWSPTGVALKDGNLYILEFGFTPPGKYTPRVRKLSADGKVTVLATVGDVEKYSAQKSSTNRHIQGVPVPKRSASYAPIGIGVGIFGLALFAWWVKKRMFYHQHQGN